MSSIYEKIIDFYNINKPCEINIGICTTSDAGINDKTSYISYPRELKKNKYYFHCVFFDHEEAINEIIKLKYLNPVFFLDVENKSKFFKWKKIVMHFNSVIKFIYIQPNFITVNGLVETLIYNDFENTLIIGSGKIARDLSIRLNSISQNFYWTHSIENRFSSSVNTMNSLFANNHLNLKEIEFDCIVNTIPFKINFNINNYINKSTTFIEVTGKSLSYLNKIDCKKYRFDFSPYLIREVQSLKNLNKNKIVIGRKKFKEFFICSGGYLGEKNDLIVDNYIKPKYLIGISDGMGGFLKRINKSFDPNIKL